MVIDVHSHFLARGAIEMLRERGQEFQTEVVSHGGGQDEIFIKGKSNGNYTEEKLWSPELRIKDMDAQGVDLSLLSIVPNYMYYDVKPKTCLRYCEIQNDEVAQAVKLYPDRFKGIATVPLQDVNLAIEELVRTKEEHGFVGVQIGTHVNGKNLDDPELRPFFKKASELGSFILVHPSSVVGTERLTRYHLFNLIGNPLETTIAAGSIIFGGILEEFPEIKICLVHTGGYLPWIIGRWDQGYMVRKEARVNINRNPSSYLKQLYYDIIIHNPAALEFSINSIGYEQIVIGTDYPFDMGDYRHVDDIVNIEGLSKTQKKAILGDTASRLIT